MCIIVYIYIYMEIFNDLNMKPRFSIFFPARLSWERVVFLYRQSTDLQHFSQVSLVDVTKPVRNCRAQLGRDRLTAADLPGGFTATMVVGWTGFCSYLGKNKGYSTWVFNVFDPELLFLKSYHFTLDG